jgi:hypothetical protein
MLIGHYPDNPEAECPLEDLGPAETRHWRMFHELASRELPEDELAERWKRWLRIERDATTKRGTEARVHG